MEVVIGRAVHMTFEDEGIRRIVYNTLWNAGEHWPRRPGDPKTWRSLEIRVIEKIMNRKLKDSVLGVVLYSLVFGDPKTVFTNLRRDPYMIMALLEQTLGCHKFGGIYLNVRHTELTVGADYCQLVQIMHPAGSFYDLFWAEKFLRLALNSWAREICVEVNSGGFQEDTELVKQKFEALMESLSPEMPPEGIPEAVRAAQRPVYYYSSPPRYWAAGTVYHVYFASDHDYNPLKTYFGYVTR